MCIDFDRLVLSVSSGFMSYERSSGSFLGLSAQKTNHSSGAGAAFLNFFVSPKGDREVERGIN